MVTALEDLVAKTATQVCLTLEKCTGKLQKKEKDETNHKIMTRVFNDMLND